MKENIETISVEFEVTADLIVADPCYVDEDDAPDYEILNREEYILAYTLQALPGLWVATVDLSDEHDWGMRVSVLRALHEDHKLPSFAYWQNQYNTDELPGSAGVDSGQMFIGAAETLPIDYAALMEEHEQKGWDRKIHGFQEGVISPTGFGDGAYPVTVVSRRDDPDNLVVGVQVEFMRNEGEEQI